MNQQTICIIGAEGKQASVVARALAVQTNHRLLLLSDNKEFLQKLFTDIHASRKNAPVELIDCMVEGSWEADIIIIDMDHAQLETFAEKLAIVANQKIIIHFSHPAIPSVINPGFNTMPVFNWTNWFPHTRLVRVFVGSLASMVESDDPEASGMVMQLLGEAGLNPFASEKHENRQPAFLNTVS